jgi:hypothetical protein
MLGEVFALLLSRECARPGAPSLDQVKLRWALYSLNATLFLFFPQ